MLDPSIYEEWLELATTREFLVALERLRLSKLESILVSEHRNEACGVVKGITLVKSLIESAKVEGL